MTDFLSSDLYSIDEKGRLSFPAKILKMLPTKTKRRFTVLRAWDGQPCLRIYTEEGWKAVANQIKSRVNPFVEKEQMFMRVIFGRAIELELDGAMRLSIPRALLDLAGIEKQTLLVGVSDHIELWNPEQYHKVHQQIIDNISAIAQEVMGGSRA